MVKDKIEKLLVKIVPEGTKILIEGTKNTKFGDYSTNVAFLLAQKEKKSPQEMTKSLIQKIPQNDFLEKVEASPNGFINFWISEDWLKQQIQEILSQKEKFGSFDIGKNQKVQVEFISANPTGPLTLGNGRGGFFGDVLARILEKSGYKIEREYFINDSGNQIVALGHSVLKDPQAVYKGKYINEIAKKIKETDAGKAGEKAAEIILEDFIKNDVEKMKIKFDKWVSENNLKKCNKVKKVIEILSQKGLVYEKDGARWLKTVEYGDDQDRVLIRKDGQTSYFASDIAYHLDKIDRGFDKIIDIWGADHAGHLKRMKAAGKILGFDDKLKIIICQLVRLVEDGQEVKMSKREGNVILMTDLIKDVGLDVARFFFLTKTPNTHLDFDLKLAKEQSKKNPVFYIQYVSARIHGILAKFKIQNSKFKITLENLKLFKEPGEINLIKHLVKFPDLIKEVSQNYEVHLLPNYTFELAEKFHQFYEKHRVICEDQKLTQARLTLIEAVKIVLKNCLNLMGISVPEKM